MNYILKSITIIENMLSSQELCDGISDKLHAYLEFLESSKKKIPSLDTIRRKMLQDVKKAIHTENYSSSEDFFYILSIFFEKLFTYISTYNAIRKKRKMDKQQYEDFCQTIFVGQTPCFELTFETLSTFLPTESVEIEEKEVFSMAEISKKKIFIDYNERAIQELLTVSDEEEFFNILSRSYQKFLCFLFNSECGIRAVEIVKLFNPISMFEFLIYFGYIDSFDFLEDIIDPTDLEETMEKMDLGFIEGEDYISSKICC